MGHAMRTRPNSGLTPERDLWLRGIMRKLKWAAAYTRLDLRPGLVAYHRDIRETPRATEEFLIECGRRQLLSSGIDVKQFERTVHLTGGEL